jgi:hypothetical protein
MDCSCAEMAAFSTVRFLSSELTDSICRHTSEHSGRIQGTFREDSRNIQGGFKEHSGRIQGTFGEDSRNIQGGFKEHSGRIQGTFREDSRNIQEDSV